MVSSLTDLSAPDYMYCILSLPHPVAILSNLPFPRALLQGKQLEESHEGLATRRDALSSPAPPSFPNSPELKEAMLPSGGWARVGPGKRTGARRGKVGEAPKGTEEAGVVAGGPLGASGVSGAGAKS